MILYNGKGSLMLPFFYSIGEVNARIIPNKIDDNKATAYSSM